MDNSIMTGLFTVAGTFIGAAMTSFVAIYSIKHTDITRDQKDKIQEMLVQLKGFHELEEIYIQKLIGAREKNGDKTFVSHDSIVKETRKELREQKIDFDFSPSDIKTYQKSFKL